MAPRGAADRALKPRKTYCLYEAPGAEAIREAARRNGLPADVVIEVGEMRPPQRSGAAAA